MDLKKQPENIKEEIAELLKNGHISRKDLRIILNLIGGSVRHHLNKLQEEGIIEHNGSDKGGYRKVNNKDMS